MNIAKYILEFFRQKVAIVMSWGFHNAAAIRNGIRFEVDGFLFSGVVKVLYDEGYDTFTVRLETSNGAFVKEREDVYFDELVDVIDRLVEKCPNYEERVRAEYGFVGGAK